MNSQTNTMTTINAQSNQLYEELKKLGWIPEDKTLEEWENLWKDRPTFIAPEKKEKKKKKEPEARCIARVWGNKDDPNVATGLCQCTKSRKDGSEYCTQHAAQAAICVPVGGYACENPWGLDHGRIDEYIPVADKHGRIIKKWNKGAIAEEIEEKIQSGEYKNNGYEAAWNNARKSLKIRKLTDYTEDKYREFQSKMADFEPNEKKPRVPRKKKEVADSDNTEISQAVRELENDIQVHTSAETQDVQLNEEGHQEENSIITTADPWITFVKDGTNYFVEEVTYFIFSDEDREKDVGSWEDPSQQYTKESFNQENIKWGGDDSDDDSDDDN